MTTISKYLVAAAAIGGLAAPALAQYPGPYPQQPYPPQYPQGYPGQPGYAQNPIQSVIDQLLGNRYQGNDRTAVQRCATAAVAQASSQYRGPGYGQQGYNPYAQQGYNPYAQQGYNPYAQQGYNPYAQQGYNPYGQQQYAQPYAYGVRVTAITNVERRRASLRVSGMLDSGRFGQYGNQGYGQGYGYGNPSQAYAGATGDLSFRCDVDYRGVVTNLRVRPNNAAYRRY